MKLKLRAGRKIMEELKLNKLEKCLALVDESSPVIQKNSFGEYLANLTDEEMYNSFSKYGVSEEKVESWIRDSRIIRNRAKKNYSY